MLYILMGPDDFSLRESLSELKKSLGDAAMLALNTAVLEGPSLTVAELKAVVATVPFLAERRLAIVNGLLGRFEPKGRGSRQTRAERSARQEDDYRAFAAAATEAVPPSTILVLVDGEVGASNPLLKMLTGKADVRNFPLLRGARLQQWIQGRVKKEGGAISPAAVGLLARLVGSNLWVMANEVNKLIVFSAGRRIEEEDIRAVVSYAHEASVFAMVDAILESRPGAAGQLLQQLMREGASPMQLLAMLSRQARLIIRVKEMKNGGQPLTEIQTRVGLTRDFAWRKVLEQADRYSLARVKELFPKLLATDLAIKTGKYDGELALNILIAELCQRA